MDYEVKRCINQGCIYHSHTQHNYCTEYKNIELCDDREEVKNKSTKE